MSLTFKLKKKNFFVVAVVVVVDDAVDVGAVVVAKDKSLRRNEKHFQESS